MTVTVDGDFKTTDPSNFNESVYYYEKEDDDSETDILDEIMSDNDLTEDDLVQYAG